VTDGQDQPESKAMELVMPFVVVASKGGPYDDESFAAGWQAGQIEGALATAVHLGATRLHFPIFRTALLKQVDLIAMRHGYTASVEASEEWPEWGALVITKETDQP
jgi:hypothetical protein